MAGGTDGPRQALDLAEALRRLEQHARQQDGVARLGRRALAGVDIASLFDDAARTTAAVLDTAYAGVFVFADDRLVLRAVEGLPPGTARDLELTRADAMPPISRLDTAEPVLVPDWERERELRRPPYAVELGVRSTVAVPLTGRRTHGVLAAARTVPWRAGVDEIRFMEGMANVLAAALDREVAESAGRERSLHDPLTALPNRALALDRLDHALRRGGGDAPLAVVVADIDRFKRVNDTFGVAAGDDAVRAVGARLRSLADPADTVARLGGDTFVVVAEHLPDEAAAAALAARIVDEVRTSCDGYALTVSVGVAIAEPGDAAGDVLRDAEAAMDRAKTHGRDRFEISDPAVRAQAVERLELERDLRGAVARGELFVAHQPIVSVGRGKITGTEALVRWRHPERGVVPPGAFIGIAEESGLIAQIGAWVLERACADVAAQHRRGRSITCHVNLSPVQASDPDLPRFVADVLADTGLPPEALVLELTESTLMRAEDDALSVMQQLRTLGVRVVLDDFGTGYSSLARLRWFPIDGLKVDRSFVADLDSDEPADALLVSGIVELARALGLTVVAEGVETPAQLARLDRLGCRYAQGFLLARPAPVPELDRLLGLDSLLPQAA